MLLSSFSNKGKIKELKIGKKMPFAEYKMENIDGKEYVLKDLAEKNGIIVIFSCNTCPFVVGNDNFEGWEHTYNELHKIAKESSMSLVLVNSNAAKRDGVDSMDEMEKHAKDNDYTMKYLVDKDAQLADQFGAKTTPHVFLFKGDLKLAYRGMIDNSVDSKAEVKESYLLDAIRSISKNDKIETQTTAPRGCSIKRK